MRGSGKAHTFGVLNFVVNRQDAATLNRNLNDGDSSPRPLGRVLIADASNYPSVAILGCHQRRELIQLLLTVLH